MTLLPINLPQGSEVRVKVGEKVTKGTVLAQTRSISSEVIIHLTKDFGIPLKNFESALSKKLGDFVKEGEPIAVKKKFMGKSRILSKISGTVSKIDVQNGDVYIKSSTGGEGKAEDVFSPVEGIVDFCDNGKIVIKSDKASISVKDVIGESVTGILTQVLDAETAQIVEDKIICIESADKLFVYKSLSLGARGIISTDLTGIDFMDLDGKKVNGAIVLVDKDSFGKIKKMIGKNINIDIENKSITVL